MWAFSIGRVVRYRWPTGTPVPDSDISGYGHVTGFGRNALDETTVQVKWDSGNQGEYHPARLCIED
jgi:hypothetical protein